MNVYLSTEIFQDTDNHEDLDHLIRLVTMGRHELILKTESEIQAILDSEWANGLRINTGSFFSMLIDQIYKRLAYEKPIEDIIVVNQDADETSKKYLLKNAMIYLTQPVSIILENSHYDKFFLDALFKNFVNRSRKINRAVKGYYLEFVNAGGKNNIPHLINDYIKKYEPLTNSLYYLRSCVIIDSDKQYPTMITPNQNIVKVCNDNNIPIHVLHKREVENYLPIEFADPADGNLTNYYNSYISLSEDQKDFIDLKEGFKNKGNLDDFPVQVQELFENLAQGDFERLRDGFKVPGLNSTQFLCPLFESKWVSQETLKHRCGSQPDPEELEHILELINSLL